MKDEISIGEKIKTLRIRAGMTQEELAEKLNTTKQTIYKYETGIVSNLPLFRVSQLANALNCSPLYLCGWEENEKPDESLAGLKREEQDLVKLFRRVPEKDRALVLSLIRAALDNQ